MGFLLTAFLFALASTLGAAIRWGVSHFIFNPWSTLLVNILGSLLIGFLFIYLERFSPSLKMLFCVAFLGALTTYSSFALDMVKMLENGSYSLFTAYFLLSNGGCLLACYLGVSIAKKVVTTL